MLQDRRLLIAAAIVVVVLVLAWLGGLFGGAKAPPAPTGQTGGAPAGQSQ
jgi:hypothetical protein